LRFPSPHRNVLISCYLQFYQILAAPDSEKVKFWDKLKGTNNNSYKYIGDCGQIKIEGMTDLEHFHHTVKTLAKVNVAGDNLRDLFRAIVCVMQCGNLTFDSLGGDTDKSEITSKDVVLGLSDLLGVEEGVLSRSFTERTMKTRTETYKVPLNPNSAKDASDALAKEIYGKVFLWLVKQINVATCAEDNYKDGTMETFGLVGLLDIFGFESFPTNRFEQLCINYANEKLQQKFTEDVFRAVQDEYEAEGIELADISYDDNTDVLDLIEGRGGLLAMLNEECVRPGGNDQEFVQKALQAQKKSPCLIENKLNRMSFGIHHYAGKVMYDADQFVNSNTDSLPTDLGDLCALSTNTIIAQNQDAVEKETTTGRGAPKRQKSNLVAPTAWAKYKTQLTSLMMDLRKTSSRYIRCVKPNMAKKPIIMDHIPTVEQLRCAGVVAAVTLSRSAFPNRLDNAVVRYRYSSMWDGAAFPSKKDSDSTPAMGLKQDCDALLSSALKVKEEVDGGKVIKAFVCGRTRCYFRAGALEYLEANRMENGLDAPATVIQAIARGYVVRKTWDSMVGGAKEAELAALAEEERKRKEKQDKADAALAKKRQLEAKKAKEEAAAKAKEEADEREMKIWLAKKRADQLAADALAREEETAQIALKKLQKKIKKLKKTLADTEEQNDAKIKEAEDEVRQVEEQKDEYQKKYDMMLEQAGSTPQDEIQANKKKIEEAEKICSYLKKENKKVRDKTEEMKDEMKEMKEQNSRLIEANASAGASLDSMDKQKKNLGLHNIKLDDNLKKWKAQNGQLQSDLANRSAYFKAETKIRALYEKAMEQIVEILEEKCDDADLVEEVTAAQLQCEALAAHKASGIPDDEE
jgi:myosin heavy subunit